LEIREKVWFCGKDVLELQSKLFFNPIKNKIMAANKSCVLFDGGKRIKLSTDVVAGNEGIRLTKNADGSWNINIRAQIRKEDARNIIFKFSELDPQGKPFEDVFPNMIFYPAMDSNEQPVDAELDFGSEIIPCFDRDLGGSIILKMNIPDSGKTQNVKTQNVHIED
jgi:hypothetical protein